MDAGIAVAAFCCIQQRTSRVDCATRSRPFQLHDLGTGVESSHRCFWWHCAFDRNDAVQASSLSLMRVSLLRTYYTVGYLYHRYFQVRPCLHCSLSGNNRAVPCRPELAIPISMFPRMPTPVASYHLALTVGVLVVMLADRHWNPKSV